MNRQKVLTPWGHKIITRTTEQRPAHKAMEQFAADCLQQIFKARDTAATEGRAAYLDRMEKHYANIWNAGFWAMDFGELDPEVAAYMHPMMSGKATVPKELSPSSTYEGNAAAVAAVKAAGNQVTGDGSPDSIRRNPKYRAIMAALAAATPDPEFARMSNAELFKAWKSQRSGLTMAKAVRARALRDNMANAYVDNVWKNCIASESAEPAPIKSPPIEQPSLLKGDNMSATNTAIGDPEAKRMAAAEWDSDPSVRAGFSTKDRYVNVRAAELAGKLRSFGQPSANRSGEDTAAVGTIATKADANAPPTKPDNPRDVVAFREWAADQADWEIENQPDRLRGFSSKANYKTVRVAELTGRLRSFSR